jgi:hypothetical protein
MTEEKKQEEGAMALRDLNGNDVFKINIKGEVFWFDSNSEEFQQAKVDADLGKAMSLAILQVAGMDYHRLLEVYLGEAIFDFKKRLMEKLVKEDGKVKSVKKTELLKIISEFK